MTVISFRDPVLSTTTIMWPISDAVTYTDPQLTFIFQETRPAQISDESASLLHGKNWNGLFCCFQISAAAPIKFHLPAQDPHFVSHMGNNST